MKRLEVAAIAVLTFAIAACLLLLATSRADAQVRYGVLGDQPVQLLAERYNPRAAKPAVFCFGRDVKREAVPFDDRDRFVIPQSLVPAIVTGVDTLHAVTASGDTAKKTVERFLCPRGTPEAHYHQYGNCNPSRDDYEQLVREGDEFGVIYCGHARFYWREEAQAMLTPPIQVRHVSTGGSAIPAPTREHRRWLRAQLVAGAAGVVGMADPDHSLWTDPDPWTSRDKAEHVVAGGLLYSLCRSAGAGPRESLGCGVIASAAWEVGQAVRGRRRYVSLKDFVAGSSGALGGYLLERGLARFR